MKLSKLLENVNIIECTAELEQEISGICYDSRRSAPGSLFVAIEGYAADGHEFIPAAHTAGALACVCQKKPEIDIPYILVEDSRVALALVSAAWFDYPAREMTLVGVTGTNGKTTTTYLVKTILEEVIDARVGLIGTNQNIIGDMEFEAERTTPESYELHQLFRKMADAGCTHVVMEVSSHALSLSRVAGLEFEIGVFTNLTQDHLDFYEDMESYAAAKAQLFKQCETAVINIDDAWAERMLEGCDCEVFRYSAKHNAADIVAKNIKLKADRVEFEALLPYHIEKIVLGIPGEFSVYNALAAIGAALSIGMDLSHIAKALASAEGVKGRVEVVPTPGKDFTVLIDYAHSPDAIENILNAVRGYAPGRVVLLFGCGGDRDRSKRPLMGEVAVRLSDFVIVTSDNPRTEQPAVIIEDILEGLTGSKTPYIVIEDRRQAIKWAIDNARKDDIIILAGKGHELYQEVGKEKYHFDEREEVAKNL